MNRPPSPQQLAVLAHAEAFQKENGARWFYAWPITTKWRTVLACLDRGWLLQRTRGRIASKRIELFRLSAKGFEAYVRTAFKSDLEAELRKQLGFAPGTVPKSVSLNTSELVAKFAARGFIDLASMRSRNAELAKRIREGRVVVRTTKKGDRR